jgi:hypothetical protein
MRFNERQVGHLLGQNSRQLGHRDIGLLVDESIYYILHLKINYN